MTATRTGVALMAMGMAAATADAVSAWGTMPGTVVRTSHAATMRAPSGLHTARDPVASASVSRSAPVVPSGPSRHKRAVPSSEAEATFSDHMVGLTIEIGY